MLRYVIYKICNEISYSCAKNTDQFPMVALIGPRPAKIECIQFDFSHSTTHLGDRLFFIPLIASLILNGFNISLSAEDRITNQIFTNLYDIPELPTSNKDAVDLIVMPKPSWLAIGSRHQPHAVVDFTDVSAEAEVTRTLQQNFYRLIRKPLPPYMPPSCPAVLSSALEEILTQKGQCYLLSNYIGSGLFRKWFLNENKLFDKCRDLKSEGFQIVHVGSTGDKLLDGGRLYPFVDIDLRGRLTLSEMVSLVGDSRVVGAVTYDNFLMHLIGISQKTAYVLFRGRFFEKNHVHHLKYVNSTFYTMQTLLKYL